MTGIISEIEERRTLLIDTALRAIKRQEHIISLLKIMELNCILEFQYGPYGFDKGIPFLVYVRDIRGATIKLQVLSSPINHPLRFLTNSKKGPLIYVRNSLSKDSCLDYSEIKELKQVPISDLPLYIGWAWKSPEFSQLLSGKPNKGSPLDRILKKALCHG